MKLSLVVMTPGNKMEGKVLEIKLAQFVVGRDPQCHLRPASALISKRHCALLQREGKVFVRDFGSTNGTFVNEEPVKSELELHHDDKLKIGPLLFAVRIEQDAPAAKKTLTPPPPTRPSTRAAKPVGAAAAEGGGDGPVGASAPSSDSSGEQEAVPADLITSGGGKDSDEDAAALLLSLEDEKDGTANSEVPEGSTVHDLSVGPDVLAAAEQKGSEVKKPAAPRGDGNTQAAADAILKKFSRRTRKAN
jgi:pSer/pThr/pTyr-binding forkhead associated (FHA) protein